MNNKTLQNTCNKKFFIFLRNKIDNYGLQTKQLFLCLDGLFQQGKFYRLKRNRRYFKLIFDEQRRNPLS